MPFLETFNNVRGDFKRDADGEVVMLSFLASYQSLKGHSGACRGIK